MLRVALLDGVCLQEHGESMRHAASRDRKEAYGDTANSIASAGEHSKGAHFLGAQSKCAALLNFIFNQIIKTLATNI